MIQTQTLSNLMKEMSSEVVVNDTTISDSADNESLNSFDDFTGEGEDVMGSNHGLDVEEKTDEAEQEAEEPSPSIANTDISSLVDKMLTLGYFHNDSSTVDFEEEICDEDNLTVELMKEYQASYMDRKKFQCDQECSLLFPTRTTPTTISDSNENESDDKEGTGEMEFDEKKHLKQIFCMTRDHLRKEMYSVTQNEGRVSLTEVCDQMKLPMDDVHRAAKEILHEERDGSISNQKQEGLEQRIYLIQKELITESFLNDIFESKVLTKLNEKGSISVSDLAMSYFHLPLEFMLEVIENRLVASTGGNVEDGGNWSFKPDVKLIMGNDGVKKIVTAQYENKRIEEIKNSLSTASEPVKLIDIFHTIDWDPHDILSEIRRLCSSHELEGEVHTDNSSSNVTTGAIYIPDAYEQNQKSTIETMFQTQGYITKIQANQIGVSVKRLEELISDILNNDNDAIILPSCIIHRDIFLSPLQVIVEECIEMESFLDLSLHLPSEILFCKDDVRTVMMEYILPKKEMEASSGSDPATPGHYVLLEEEEALYFSQGLINNISEKILQPLIENYAKSRAKEIVHIVDESKKKKNNHQSSGTSSISGKDGNKSKKNYGKPKNKSRNSKKKSMTEDVENDNDTIEAPKAGLPQLKTVVKAIGEVYTDIMDIQDSYDDSENNHESGWYAIIEGRDEYDGPLYGFCRCVLNKDSKLERICSDAVDAEIQKILKLRQGSSTSMNRKEGAMKCQNIEKLFEEHFPTACHYIQLKAKFPQFCMSSSDMEVNEEEMNIIAKDFLHNCAWFAKRITEYCLFKAGLDSEEMFQFTTEFKKQDDEESQEENFYSPIDLTERFVPKVFLSCISDGDGGDWKDPLQLLREIMPGNIGVGLARMWIHTGGEHYDGGTKISENDDGTRSSFVRPGDMNKFVAHVEENCLTIVGIPFKLLDKKAEKKLMFSRRKELSTQLQGATSAEKIYDLSIMLLYQQLRSMIVRVDSCNDSNSRSYNNEEERCIIKVILRHLFDNGNEKKKIPLQVKEHFDQASSLLFQGCSNEVKGNIDLPENLVQKLKDCGLSKDISSHVVSMQEEE